MQISTGEINWFYTTKGQGEPLLFLHGGLNTCENYETLLAELANGLPRYRCLTDAGTAEQRTRKRLFEYALMAEELISFTQALDLPPFHIVGYSDGANLGLHMASRLPGKAKSLIAISGNYLGVSGMSQGWLETVEALSADFVQEHMPEVVQQYAELNPAPMLESFINKTKEL